MTRFRHLPCLVLLSLSTTACWRSKPKLVEFEVLRTSPELGASAQPLLLNDSVTVYFSDALHALSVTSDAISVLDAEGNQVPGSLRVGANWVTFEPRPPLTASLADGSFHPASRYRLQVAGYPRPDAVRAADGRRLAAARTYEFRTAGLADVSPTRPAPLRPVAELPFVLRNYDLAQPLPADAPRLQMHFTLPVLPASVSPDAFRIQRLGSPLEQLLPRSIRVITSRLDDFPGSTIEIDLGTTPRRIDGGLCSLRKDDYVSVSLSNVTAPLLDYAGNAVLCTSDPFWTVVPGNSVALVEWPWPGKDGGIVGDDPVLPGFEAVCGIVRPCVRVEAGDGSLGVFRPRADTVLQPGVPFDRGDGVLVVSREASFPFLGIDIPAGIKVRVEATSGPVQLLSCGSVRIAGELQIAASSRPLQVPRHGTAVQELIDASPVAIVAAGGVTLRGRITLATELAGDHSALTLAAASAIQLLGEPLPYNSILAVEAAWSTVAEPPIVGLRGQVATTVVTFTYGMAPACHWTARGVSPWRALPIDRDGGVLRLVDVEDGLLVQWQATAADAVRVGEPDLTPGRVGRVERAADQDLIQVGTGGFVRFLIEAELRSGGPLPSFRELRLSDR